MFTNRIRFYFDGIEARDESPGPVPRARQIPILAPPSLAEIYRLAWEQAKFDHELSRLFNPPIERD